MSDMFEEFWCTIPRRNRPHPKHLTRTRWDRIIKNGVKPEDLIAAAREWRKKEEELKLIGTEFVPMASTWLHQKRFLDYQVDCGTIEG